MTAAEEMDEENFSSEFIQNCHFGLSFGSKNPESILSKSLKVDVTFDMRQ